MGTVTDYPKLTDSFCKWQMNGSRTVGAGLKSAKSEKALALPSPVQDVVKPPRGACGDGEAALGEGNRTQSPK